MTCFAVSAAVGVGLLAIAHHKIAQKTGVQFFGSRPHHSLPVLPLIHSPAAWNGNELQQKPSEWTYQLTNEDIVELEEALKHFKEQQQLLQQTKRGKYPQDPTSSFGSDIDIQAMLPFSKRFQQEINNWQCQVNTRCPKGRGFQLIKGLPVDRWSYKDTAIVYQALGLYLGNGHELIDQAEPNNVQVLVHVRNEQNDTNTTTSTIITDTDNKQDATTKTKTTNEQVRLFKTQHAINFHCDGTDVVGLLCITPSDNRSDIYAGISNLISSVKVYNQLVQRRPDVARYLLDNNVLLDTRGGGGVPYIPIKPLRLDRDGPTLRSFWHQDYFGSALSKYSHQKEFQQVKHREALDVYNDLLNSKESRDQLWLRMQLEPGDIQLVSNHFILHGRNAFVDHDNGAKRDLLRMWITLADLPKTHQSWMSYWDETVERFFVIKALVQVKLRIAVGGGSA